MHIQLVPTTHMPLCNLASSVIELHHAIVVFVSVAIGRHIHRITVLKSYIYLYETYIAIILWKERRIKRENLNINERKTMFSDRQRKMYNLLWT